VRRLEREVEEARRRLASKEQQLYAWRRGLDGERRTGEALALLESRGWVVLHDLHWPGRPFANIDHIAVGPSGVFVIDSKNWTGDVLVRDGVLRQNGSRRSDACEGAAAASAAVAAFLEPQHRSLVTAVLCLVDQPTPAHQPAQAHIVGLADLVESLTSGPQRLGSTDVGRIGDYLRRLLSGPRSPAMKTTAALATAGAAPREPRPASTRRHVRRSGQRRSSSPSRRSARRRESANMVPDLLKVVAVLVFALVILPRWLPAMTDSMTSNPPSVTTPAARPSVTTPSKGLKTTSPTSRPTARATRK
jgi:hypothetical protein